MTEQLPLKIEGYVVPILTELGDPFKFKVHPTALTRYTDTNITCETDDWRMIARLYGREPDENIHFNVVSKATYTKVTIYLDVTSLKYKPAEFHRDPFGVHLDTGYLQLHGKLLTNEPPESTSLDELVAELNKREIPIIEHTHDGLS